MIQLIGPDQLNAVWRDAVTWLEPAIKRSGGRYTLPTVYDALKRGDMQLWTVGDAYCVTEVANYPAMKVICLHFLGGRNMARWIHEIAHIEEWARLHGCECVEITGRPGWALALPGYARSGYTTEKKL